MGCCFSSGEPTEVGPAFDPVIGLSSKNKAPTVTVQGSTISGSGSVLAEMPVLQDKAYFETTVVTPGSFAIGFVAFLLQNKKAVDAQGTVSHVDSHSRPTSTRQR